MWSQLAPKKFEVVTMASISKFRPSFISLVFLVAVVTVLMRLGFWQLNRADEKAEVLNTIAEAKPLVLGSSVIPVKKWHGSKVTGRLELIDPAKYWLLDNQVYQGQVGYSVISLAESASTQRFLLNLGWVKAPQYRAQLPDVSLPTELNVSGILRSNDYDSFVLDESMAGESIRVQSIEQIFRQLAIQPNEQSIIYANDSTIQNWPQIYKPVVMPPEKHTAYAVQWFLLALASVIVFCVAWVKKGRSNEST